MNVDALSPRRNAGSAVGGASESGEPRDGDSRAVSTASERRTAPMPPESRKPGVPSHSPVSSAAPEGQAAPDGDLELDG